MYRIVHRYQRKNPSETSRLGTAAHSFSSAAILTDLLSNFQGTLDVDGGWLVPSRVSDVQALSVQTAGPYCCSCRRADCVDLLRRPAATSPGRVVASEDLQRPLPNGDEAQSVSSYQQQNSTRVPRPRPSSDVTVTPIWRHLVPSTPERGKQLFKTYRSMTMAFMTRKKSQGSATHSAVPVTRLKTVSKSCSLQ